MTERAHFDPEDRGSFTSESDALSSLIDATKYIHKLDPMNVPDIQPDQKPSDYSLSFAEYIKREKRRVIKGLAPGSSRESASPSQGSNNRVDADFSEHGSDSVPFSESSQAPTEVDVPPEVVTSAGEQVLRDVDDLDVRLSYDALNDDEDDGNEILNKVGFSKETLKSKRKWLQFGISAATVFFGSAALQLDARLAAALAALSISGTMYIKSMHGIALSVDMMNDAGEFRGKKIRQRIANFISKRSIQKAVATLDAVASNSIVLGVEAGLAGYSLTSAAVNFQREHTYNPALQNQDKPKTELPVVGKNGQDDGSKNINPVTPQPEKPIPPSQSNPVQTTPTPEVIGQPFDIKTTVWGHEREFVDELVKQGTIPSGHENAVTNMLKNWGWAKSHGIDIGHLAPGQEVELLNRPDATQAARMLVESIDKPELRSQSFLYSILYKMGAVGYKPSEAEANAIATLIQ